MSLLNALLPNKLLSGLPAIRSPAPAIGNRPPSAASIAIFSGTSVLKYSKYFSCSVFPVGSLPASFNS